MLYGDDIIANEVQPDDLREVIFLEVTPYCVSNVLRQLLGRVTIGKNCLN